MIEIDGKVVSMDLFRENFVCDLRQCRGMCCVEGNAGAPLEMDELTILESEYEGYKPYMKPEGIKTIEKEGFVVIDIDGDHTTPLIDGLECVYSFDEGGVTLCAIEKAWMEGRTKFRKPVSCHLYPIRVIKFERGGCGLNYHRWDICTPAVECGGKSKTPVYKSLKEPLIRYFGEQFYEALEEIDRYLKETADIRESRCKRE